MIPQRAIDAYLTRSVDAKTWAKQLTPLEVAESLAQMRPAHQFTAPLWHEQRVCFLLGAAFPELVYLLGLGLGKTVLSLELLSYFYNNGFVRRAFVLVPTKELAEGWEDEIHKWGFSIPYRILEGSSKQKWQQLSEFGNGLVIATYSGIAAMVSTPAPVRGKERRKMVPQKAPLAQITESCDALVCDQSTRVGSRQSLTYKVVLHFAKRAQIRYCLAGRAFGRDPLVLWTQFYIADHGRALGENIGLFREAFYRKIEKPWGAEWVLRKRREPLLAQFLTASSIRYSAEECLSLPPKSHVVKECTFPDETWSYYDQIRGELLQSRGNFREVKNSFLRMRQMSSGFLGFIDDESGERAQIEFDQNPKLDLLLDLIEEVPSDQKMVIIYEYHWSGQRICAALQKRKIAHGWLWGGTQDWSIIKHNLNTNPEYRVLVANWKKAAMGLNLQSASYLFMYESPVSVIERTECEGRIHRQGQGRHCFVYDLIVRDSVDARILEFHRTGADLWRALIEDPAKVVNDAAKRRTATRV